MDYEKFLLYIMSNLEITTRESILRELIDLTI